MTKRCSRRRLGLQAGRRFLVISIRVHAFGKFMLLGSAIEPFAVDVNSIVKANAIKWHKSQDLAGNGIASC
jgi:hypothetical protein